MQTQREIFGSILRLGDGSVVSVAGTYTLEGMSLTARSDPEPTTGM